MESILLATRLQVPLPARTVIHRARLIETLERDAPACRAALLTAPAGYGKTTLLADWARSSSLSVAWHTLAIDDNDPERFARCLLLAWQRIDPGILDTPAGVLLAAASPDVRAALAAFINVVAGKHARAAIVLDDAHLLTDAPSVELLAFLLDNLPPDVHLVLAGRGAPALPFARYRARQQLLELDASDLQFSMEEAAAFLQRATGRALDPGAVAAIHSRLEGWAAGLQLAALTLQRRTEADPLAVSGRGRHIADYLSEEALGQLPQDTQRFLLHTSVLDHLCARLCDAVTGQNGSQQTLEALERANLFLTPLDDNREWYRYHATFAEFLLGELARQSPDLVPLLHQRAARWLLDHDLPEQAFRHAVAGDDVDLAGQIAERHFLTKLLGREIAAVRRMLDALPPHWRSAHPAFDLSRVALLLLTGAVDDAIRTLDDVERRLEGDASQVARDGLARATAFHCFVACFTNDLPRAEAYAVRALDALPPGDPVFRPGIYGALGDTYRRNGFWREARESYRKALEFVDSPTVRFESAHAYGALADLALRQGRLREAGDYWDRAFAVINDRRNWGRIPLPVIGWVRLRMGELLCEWNDLDAAWDHLSRGLERAELGGDTRALLAGHVVAARLNLAQGNLVAAAECLERAREWAGSAAFPDWTSRFERVQLDLWLAQDQLRTAAAWADDRLRDDAFLSRPENEPARLALCLALIVKGDAQSRRRALALLGTLLDEAREAGMGEVEIAALALQALALWRDGDRPAALIALERALWLAEPEGYVRLFADLGPRMTRLLQEARARGTMREYVETLLAACDPLPDAPSSARGAYLDPLTSRESEILALLATGMTNQEIAARLSISAETVKKHVGNVYAKLGVHRRTEAVARARALDLLG